MVHIYSLKWLQKKDKASYRQKPYKFLSSVFPGVREKFLISSKESNGSIVKLKKKNTFIHKAKIELFLLNFTLLILLMNHSEVWNSPGLGVN